MTGKELLRLQKALKSGEKLDNEQVAHVAKLRREENAGREFITVGKFELREGEELWDFAWTMMDAVQTNRIILADGSLDAWLQGIYEDHVIVMDGNTGKLFKSNFTRNADGEFVFEEPVEVMQVFVPVNAPADGGGDDLERAVQKRAPQGTKRLEITKRDNSKWAGLVPSHLRGR